MAEPTNVIRFLEKVALFELGLEKVYSDTLKTEPITYKKWLREKNMKRWIEFDMATSGLGVMGEKEIGGRFPTDRIYYGPQKSYTGKAYGAALVIQYEAMRWDEYEVFPGISRELAKTANTRYDIIAYGVFNSGFVTTDSTYTDAYNQALFSATHTRHDGGTWSNRPASPTGLSMLGLETGNTTLRKTVNHRGIFTQDLTPKQLIVAVEIEWLANTLIMSSTNPDNANQQYNNARRMNLDVMASPYITSTTAWFLLCDKNDYDITMDLGDSPDLLKDYEPNTRNRIFTSYMSCRIRVRESRGMFGDSGA
jgi:hypothetical protein